MSSVVAAVAGFVAVGLGKALFGGRRALGQWIRINDRRYRVIGVLSDSGESLGQNLDDMIVIPVAAAQS